MRIGKKTIHDVTIGLAMALPILYLGGSMIAGLAGAHGEKLWASAEESEQYTLDFDLTKELFINFTTGQPNSSDVYHWATGNFYTLPYFELGSYSCELFSDDYFVARVFTYNSDGSYLGYSEFTNTNPFSINYSDKLYKFALYFPNVELDSVSFKLVVRSPYYSPALDAESYSDYLFGNFFPRNNFVERIGQNALSDNPKGFAPFGTMLSYLDSNVFHAGDSQTALMVYGMVYWSLHVIIADLVYHVLVFVPNLINKVFSWFGQRGLSDD